MVPRSSTITNVYKPIRYMMIVSRFTIDTAKYLPQATKYRRFHSNSNIIAFPGSMIRVYCDAIFADAGGWSNRRKTSSEKTIRTVCGTRRASKTYLHTFI